MRIGIVGGGSIGLLIASYLSSKHTVTLYVRREHQKKIINEKGLFLSDDLITTSVKALLLNEVKTEDLLIICVKQTQILSVIDKLNNNMFTIPLLFLQNGMGHIEYLKSIRSQVFIGVVEHGALRESDNSVLHTGKGIIQIAQYNTSEFNLNKLIEQLSSADFPIYKSTEWKKLLTEKLIINAVINPLTTLFNVKNGTLISDSHLKYLAERICEEVAVVLDLNPDDQWIRVKRIAIKTKNNTSSMLTDIKNNKPTEIEAILGYVIKQSRVEVPYTQFAYHGVKSLEANIKSSK